MLLNPGIMPSEKKPEASAAPKPPNVEAVQAYQSIRLKRKVEAFSARERLLSLCHPQELRPDSEWQPVIIEKPTIFFKVVAAGKDGQLVSIFDGATAYQLHKTTFARAGAASWPPVDACLFAYREPIEVTACLQCVLPMLGRSTFPWTPQSATPRYLSPHTPPPTTTTAAAITAGNRRTLPSSQQDEEGSQEPQQGECTLRTACITPSSPHPPTHLNSHSYPQTCSHCLSSRTHPQSTHTRVRACAHTHTHTHTPGPAQGGVQGAGLPPPRERGMGTVTGVYVCGGGEGRAYVCVFLCTSHACTMHAHSRTCTHTNTPAGASSGHPHPVLTLRAPGRALCAQPSEPRPTAVKTRHLSRSRPPTYTGGGGGGKAR